MDKVLYVQAMNAKCNNIIDFYDWLAEVKQVDDKKRFECEQAIKSLVPLTGTTPPLHHPPLLPPQRLTTLPSSWRRRKAS